MQAGSTDSHRESSTRVVTAMSAWLHAAVKLATSLLHQRLSDFRRIRPALSSSAMTWSIGKPSRPAVGLIVSDRTRWICRACQRSSRHSLLRPRPSQGRPPCPSPPECGDRVRRHFSIRPAMPGTGPKPRCCINWSSSTIPRFASCDTGQQPGVAGKAGQMAASEYAPPPHKSLAPLGASTDGKRTLEERSD